MPPASGCPATGLAYPEVTRAICLVPSASFSQAPWYALPVHLCRFRVRSMMPALFPEPLPQPPQSDKGRHGFATVTSVGPRNVDLVSISYGFRPRLRGRLTLRGLALRRNPWTFGERVSHPLCRYSCPHSHFRYLQGRSPDTPSQAYGTLRYRYRRCYLPITRSFGTWFEPRYIFGAGSLLDQ